MVFTFSIFSFAVKYVLEKKKCSKHTSGPVQPNNNRVKRRQGTIQDNTSFLRKLEQKYQLNGKCRHKLLNFRLLAPVIFAFATNEHNDQPAHPYTPESGHDL